MRKSYLTFPTSTAQRRKITQHPHTQAIPPTFFLAGHTSLHIPEASAAKHDHKQHSSRTGSTARRENAGSVSAQLMQPADWLTIHATEASLVCGVILESGGALLCRRPQTIAGVSFQRSRGEAAETPVGTELLRTFYTRIYGTKLDGLQDRSKL